MHAVLDRAVALDLASMSDDGLRGWLCGVQRLRARVEALACRAARVVEQRGVPGSEGLVSAASLAARHGNADPRVVGADRRVGWWLARFDVLEAAFESGVLTRAHVAVLRSVEDRRTSSAVVEWQRWLVEQAEALSFAEFCRVVRYWALAADPDGAEPAVQVRRRGVWWRREGDGMVRGSFLLDPLAGGVVTSAAGGGVRAAAACRVRRPGVGAHRGSAHRVAAPSRRVGRSRRGRRCTCRHRRGGAVGARGDEPVGGRGRAGPSRPRPRPRPPPGRRRCCCTTRRVRSVPSAAGSRRGGRAVRAARRDPVASPPGHGRRHAGRAAPRRPRRRGRDPRPGAVGAVLPPPPARRAGGTGPRALRGARLRRSGGVAPGRPPRPVGERRPHRAPQRPCRLPGPQPPQGRPSPPAQPRHHRGRPDPRQRE